MARPAAARHGTCSRCSGCSAAADAPCPEVARLQMRAARDGLVFVAPYDDPYTIAGQGTIGNEILR